MATKEGDKFLKRWRKLTMQSRVRECIMYKPDLIYWRDWLKRYMN